MLTGKHPAPWVNPLHGGAEPPWQPHTPMLSERGLASNAPSSLGAFSPAQNRAILIAGVTCASISLLAALLALRWFLLMRRSFRHHLILFLIFSDTFKSIWYFVFPIVVFTRGKVDSSSDFCQASGFFLALGLEASDYAILMIALHASLHIFQPLRNIGGNGGLYPYRRWIYSLWIVLPALAASLAFVNPEEAYVTSGTFCYLPKRPIWYRLALTWIPRYLIFAAILTMYAAIYLYVRIKFKGFSNLASGDSGYESGSGQRNNSASDPRDQEKGKPVDEAFWPRSKRSSKAAQLTQSRQPNSVRGTAAKPQQRAPWEDMTFITSKALQGLDAPESHGVAATDFALPESSSSSTDPRGPIRNMSLGSVTDQLPQDSRKTSEVPTIGTSCTVLTDTTDTTLHSTSAKEGRSTRGGTDPLNMTRVAIRRQLRFLFIYPAVYLLMWTFPFASHCLLYSDYYVAHPPFWLNIVTTCMLALQAGADCIVFSWRERPWTRVDEKSPLSMSGMLRFFKCGILTQHEQKTADVPDSDGLADTVTVLPVERNDSNWWEAEGKKRKDSVWMGTDILNQQIIRQTSNERSAPIHEE